MCRSTFILKIILQLFSVSTLTKAIPRIPPSPCPRIFWYERVIHHQPKDSIIFPDNDNPYWKAVVNVPNHVVNPGQKIQLTVLLSVPVAMNSKYVGRIEVRGDKTKFVASGTSTRQYDVIFPNNIPTPYLLQVRINDRVLCHGRPPRSPITTKLILEHSLFPFRVNLTKRIDDQAEPASQGHDEEIDICGEIIPNNPLIIQGRTVDVGDWPWLVPIFRATPRGLLFHCSGTLVSDKHIISAAHCYKDADNPKEYIAYVGRHNIHDWTETDSQPRGLKRLVRHPDYNADNLYSDIAILELNQPVAWTYRVGPVCLWNGPPSLDLIVGRKATVVGWGAEDLESLKLSSEPRAAVLPIVSQEECMRSSREFLFLSSNRTLCAGSRDGRGPCNGDSGGGLYLAIKGSDGPPRWYLRGVTSLSLLDTTSQKCDLHQYTVFTDVAKFQSWIRKHMSLIL